MTTSGRWRTQPSPATRRLHAHAEAVTHYENAIEAAVRLGRTERPLHHLYPTRGRALELSGRFDEATANYEAMELLANGVGDRHAALASQMALTTLLATPTPRFDAGADASSPSGRWRLASSAIGSPSPRRSGT